MAIVLLILCSVSLWTLCRGKKGGEASEPTDAPAEMQEKTHTKRQAYDDGATAVDNGQTVTQGTGLVKPSVANAETVAVQQEASSIPLLETTEDWEVWGKAIDEFLERVEAIPNDAEDFADLYDEAKRPLEALSTKELVTILNNLAATREGQNRLNVLDALDVFLADGENPEIRFSDEVEDEEAQEVKRIIHGILAGCLEDDDAEVRLHAVDTLERLPRSVGDALHGVAITGSHADVAERLLLNHANSDDFRDLALFFHALDSEDEAISAMARENALNVTGKEFATAEEAFEWWAKRQPEKTEIILELEEEEEEEEAQDAEPEKE